MEEFERLYPLEQNVYYIAKETDVAADMRELIEATADEEDESFSWSDPIDTELLQRAIETKRSLFASFYFEKNSMIAAKYVDTDQLLFISKYSPLFIADLTVETISMMEEDNDIVYLEYFENLESETELAVANAVTRADWVRDYCYNCDGTGVKIGQIECNIPKTDHTDLDEVTIIPHHANANWDDHATRVARILIGEQNGIAPNATLYSADAPYLTNFYPEVEWLIGQGVNIINMSMTYGSTYGSYDLLSKWVDHIAVQHDVHFIKSAGNDAGYITTPGMAYNVITVGGFNDHNSNDYDDDTFCTFSSYAENGSNNRAEKPNLIAPAENILIGSNDSGTSYAAPQVAGVIAQLCSFRSDLKTKQTAVGAIITAGAFRKIDASPMPGLPSDMDYGQVFDHYISGSNKQINDKEGAGLLDARGARKVANNYDYWRYTINTNEFPFTQTKYITANTSTTRLIRVAIFWLKRNTLSGDNHTGSSGSTEVPLSNLKLTVYDPNGNVVGWCNAANANYEIVQFIPQLTGTYRIEIQKIGTNSSTKEYVGIAIW